MKTSRAWVASVSFALFVLAFLLSPIAALASNDSFPDGGNSFYPAAVWYSGGRARAPMLEKIDATSAERWGKDLDSIKADGFNTVKTWIDWKTGEPAQGKYNFENLNLLLKLAHDRGLRVIIQIYMDSAPDWLGKLYPSGRFVDSSGAVINSQSAPGYSIDDPGVHKEIVSFIEALSKDANQFPALFGWDVWSEPHIINWAEFPYLKDAEFGFNPGTQARFRKWLQGKYKTLDELNAAWYRTFTSWDEVEAPRFPTILSYTDYIDWRSFIDVKIAGDLATRTEAVRVYDKTHLIASLSDAPSLFTHPTDGYGEPDDFRMAQSADFYGTSMYPMHSESIHPWGSRKVDTALHLSRSARHSVNRGFWIGELQAGQGATGMRVAAPVTADDETFWIWQAVSHGAREFAVYSWYPMSSGFESNGYGLINLDGTLTPRAKAAGKAASIIGKHAASLLNATPAPAQIAILYNRLSYMVGGSQPSLSKLGSAPIDSALGLHLAFAQKQVPVDFVSPDQVSGGKLSQYKILFVPFPVMLSANVAEGVKKFVEGGGTVVAEARMAWNNERGFASQIIPGIGLDKVFGAREILITPTDKAEISIAGDAGLPGWTNSGKVLGAAYEEQLQPYEGAHVLGRFADGEAAIVENSFGKGKAILVGSFLALGYQNNTDDATQQLLLSLAQSAGVAPEVEITGAGAANVQVRRLVSDKEEIVFAFNESNDFSDAAVALQLPWAAAKAMDWADDKDVAVETAQGKAVLKKTFAPHEVWVVSVQAK